jgi:hypothetical protein
MARRHAFSKSDGKLTFLGQALSRQKDPVKRENRIDAPQWRINHSRVIPLNILA